MKIIEVQQGTNQWKALRANHFTASEAPAMMGVSKYTSRTELLKQKATGIEPEVSPAQQSIFDKGHAAEAAARPYAEQIIGEELFPATAVDDNDYLLASFDGITMLEEVIWEHKLWNQELAEMVAADEMRPDHFIQVQQQLLVSRAEKCLFMVSDGTEENMEYTWVYPDKQAQAQIMAGWKQFEDDLGSYQHQETAVEAVGRTPDQLPAIHIEVQGMVTASNLEEFTQSAIAVFRNINTDLQTDQDFADAEKTAKWCKEVEAKLDGAKEHALSQTASIDELFRAIDSIREESRAKRLNLEKLVKSRKESVRLEIKTKAENSFRAHITKLNERLVAVYMPPVDIDIAGAMKGKKTVASMQDAADTELAAGKIRASEIADSIEANLGLINELGKKHLFLFADKQSLVMKDKGDLEDLIKARVIAHEAEEKRKEEEQRERIRKEEQAKAEIEAQQKLAAGRANDPLPQTERQDHFPDTTKMVDQDKPRVRQQSAPTKTRPTDQEIISTLAMAYRVHESKVIEWLGDMDLSDAGEKLAANF